jgi:hypothetical protein
MIVPLLQPGVDGLFGPHDGIGPGVGPPDPADGGCLQPAKKNLAVGGLDPATDVLENRLGSAAFAATLSLPHDAKTMSPPVIGKPWITSGGLSAPNDSTPWHPT